MRAERELRRRRKDGTARLDRMLLAAALRALGVVLAVASSLVLCLEGGATVAGDGMSVAYSAAGGRQGLFRRPLDDCSLLW